MFKRRDQPIPVRNMPRVLLQRIIMEPILGHISPIEQLPAIGRERSCVSFISTWLAPIHRPWDEKALIGLGGLEPCVQI